jgi:hypothetical protein
MPLADEQRPTTGAPLRGLNNETYKIILFDQLMSIKKLIGEMYCVGESTGRDVGLMEEDEHRRSCLTDTLMFGLL